MSLHCFFGVQVCADGVSVTPPMPPNSSLVLTHCALTSVQPGAVTLYVQSHDQPKRFAVCTMNAECDIFYIPLQLVFTHQVSFTLVPSKSMGSGGDAPPAVHLTGYFESEEDRNDEIDGDSSEEEDDDEEEWKQHEEEEKKMAEKSAAGGRKTNGQKRKRSDTNTHRQQQQDSVRGTKGGKNKGNTKNKRGEDY